MCAVYHAVTCLCLIFVVNWVSSVLIDKELVLLLMEIISFSCSSVVTLTRDVSVLVVFISATHILWHL